MKILAVEPGPEFSVTDVHHGWVKALRALGCDVVDFNLSDRLDFYGRALSCDEDLKAKFADNEYASLILAAKGISAAAWEWGPDVLLLTSAFYIPPLTFLSARHNKVTTVVLATESPYDDEYQKVWAPVADVICLNDPTNLEMFREVNPRTYYMPHAHDPDRHRPGPADPTLASEFAFVGSGFPSRVEFFEKVDWSGIDVLLGGNWNWLTDDSPLWAYVRNDRNQSIDNVDTVRIYQSTKTSANLYRTENLIALGVGIPEGLAATGYEGWSMGPRELELAACGVFFLRDPRPEGDEILHMLPVFDSPGDFEEKLRWWLAHDDQRITVAAQAREAVADRTFLNNARQLLHLLDKR